MNNLTPGQAIFQRLCEKFKRDEKDGWANVYALGEELGIGESTRKSEKQTNDNTFYSPVSYFGLFQNLIAPACKGKTLYVGP